MSPDDDSRPFQQEAFESMVLADFRPRDDAVDAFGSASARGLLARGISI